MCWSNLADEVAELFAGCAASDFSRVDGHAFRVLHRKGRPGPKRSTEEQRLFHVMRMRKRRAEQPGHTREIQRSAEMNYAARKRAAGFRKTNGKWVK